MKHISIKKFAVSSAAGVGGALLFAIPASALVHTADIADGAVTSAKIANGTIRTGDLKDSSVTTAKIDNNGVTSDDIANGAVTSNDIQNGTIKGGDLAPNIHVESNVTHTTATTGSFQTLSGDLTYQGSAGGTSAFHSGVMGHFHGDTLTNNTTGGVYHAGVIGGYSVTTSDANTGPKAGVVGFVGADGATTAPTAGVMSVIDGDGGIVTANAAYGVQYLNSTSGSKFTYGLDLSHAATGSYAAVTYGTADIRLSSGATIGSGATNPVTACVVGSLFLNTGAGGKLYACTATTPTWTVVGTQT